MLSPVYILFIPFFLISVIALYLYSGPFTALGQNIVPPSLRASAVTLGLFIPHLLGDSWSTAAVGILSDTFHSLQLALLITGTPMLLIAALLAYLALKSVEHDTKAMEDTWAAGRIDAVPVAVAD